MSGVDTLTPRFVEEIPDELEPGVFYVSLEHGSMLHLCACGCGHEVALPLTPLDWQFTYNGEAISVSPSVGNWSLPCRSHYIVSRGRVQWADDWSAEQIAAGRRYDQARKEARYDSPLIVAEAPAPAELSVSTSTGSDGLLKRARIWFEGIRWRL